MKINRTITCERCNRTRRTQYRYDICPTCLPKLARFDCAGCKKARRQLDVDSPLCRRCKEKYGADEICCVACGTVDFAFRDDPTHCRKCRRNISVAGRNRCVRTSYAKTVDDERPVLARRPRLFVIGVIRSGEWGTPYVPSLAAKLDGERYRRSFAIVIIWINGRPFR
jgi:hypothetical protein